MSVPHAAMGGVRNKPKTELLVRRRAAEGRVIYASHKGGKPMMIGMNHAKRVARAHDRRDQLAVLAQIGPGLPRQHQHHQNLVRQRHAYYADVYQEEQRVREAAVVASSDGDGPDEPDQDPRDALGAVPNATHGADPL